MTVIAEHLGRACAAACLGLGGCLASPALAGTTASFQVSATVVPGCEINGSAPAPSQNLGQLGTLNFGTHSALGTDTVTAVLVRNSGITLSCTPTVSLTMSLDGGQHAATTRNLQAAGGTERVAYRLYRDPGFGQELLANQGYGITFSDPYAVPLPIYGRLDLPGVRRPDVYRDTVTVTLTW